MGSQYAGANAFPVSVLLPDDGDQQNASSVNVPMQGLADRTISLKGRVDYLEPLAIDRYDILPSASGTWTCPVGVFLVCVHAWGGGGGGGGGTGGSTVTPTTRTAMGGGGGGGARRCVQWIPTVPGTVYSYTIGAGGAGGASVAAGITNNNPGGDGADSVFAAVVVGRGAAGGSAAGSGYSASANLYPAVAGGRSARLQAPTAVGDAGRLWLYSTGGLTSATSDVQTGGQGAGGGAVTQSAAEGGASADGFFGGTPGVPGATNTNLGGGAGGGGGAGPAGNGAQGGNGGVGSTGAGGSASSGFNGNAGSGAGGGGGGGGGSGTTASPGGAGGNGGSGRIVVLYRGTQAVFT